MTSCEVSKRPNNHKFTPPIQQSQNLYRFPNASNLITPSLKKSSMAFIIKSKKHLYIRVPIILFLILLFAISPILISIIGAQITEAMTNQPCHEGNCFWGGFGWLFLLTMPAAGLLFVVFLIVVIIDASKLPKK